MSILISHRGNLTSAKPDKENRPEYILASLEKVDMCEIDLWSVNQKFLLGHDKPEYEMPIDWIKDKEIASRLLIHCKDMKTFAYFNYLKSLKDYKSLIYNNWLSYFYHTNEDIVPICGRLYEKGISISFPGKSLFYNSICMMPEIDYDKNIPLNKVCGICSDEILKYKE